MIQKFWQGFMHRLLAIFGAVIFTTMLFWLMVWFLQHFWPYLIGGLIVSGVVYLVWRKYRYW